MLCRAQAMLDIAMNSGLLYDTINTMHTMTKLRSAGSGTRHCWCIRWWKKPLHHGLEVWRTDHGPHTRAYQTYIFACLFAQWNMDCFRILGWINLYLGHCNRKPDFKTANRVLGSISRNFTQRYANHGWLLWFHYPFVFMRFCALNIIWFSHSFHQEKAPTLSHPLHKLRQPFNELCSSWLT